MDKKFKLLDGCRGEEEYSKEYKQLEKLINDLEEKTDMVGIAEKRREHEIKKNDRFEVNKTISNQIHTTSNELEAKLAKSLRQLVELDKDIESMKKQTNKLINEYKKAINDLAKKKTQDLIDQKLKGQLSNVKNLFFKKVLREIVIGSDKNEEILKIFENKLYLKEKLLKKSLLAAEHYKNSIERVDVHKKEMKENYTYFFSQINSALSFGHVKLSREMNTFELRKIISREYRSDYSTRESVGIKDFMMIVGMESLILYDQISSASSYPTQVINFSDIDKISFIKEDFDPTFNVVQNEKTFLSDNEKLGSYFAIKLKNERGGLLLECSTDDYQKWDYIFFIVNLIITLGLTRSLQFRAMTTDGNFSKMLKQLNLKSNDVITIKKKPKFTYNYPLKEEKNILTDINERLIDWEIVENVSLRENKFIKEKISEKYRLEILNDGNHKQCQTDLTIVNSGMKQSTTNSGNKGSGLGSSSKKDAEFNYVVPTINPNNDPNQLFKNFKNIPGLRSKLRLDEVEEEVPSPEVELDISIDSNDVPDIYVPFDDRENNGGIFDFNQDGKNTKNKSKLDNKPKKSKSIVNSVLEPAIVASGEEIGETRKALSGDFLSRFNPFARGIENMSNYGVKGVLDSLSVEQAYKESILRTLINGVTAKSSGVGENAGQFVVKLNNNKLNLERYNINSKRKESKEIRKIKEISFKFEYKDEKSGEIMGITVILLTFIDNSFWEFQTPRKSKNAFYNCLINYRLNTYDFISAK